MNCNLTGAERADGSRCRGFDCGPCNNYIRDTSPKKKPEIEIDVKIDKKGNELIKAFQELNKTKIDCTATRCHFFMDGCALKSTVLGMNGECLEFKDKFKQEIKS